MSDQTHVDLLLCRHFQQIRGGGINGIGVAPGADYSRYFIADGLDMAKAQPLANEFVAIHGHALRAGAPMFHPGTIRGIMSAMMILETAGIPPKIWEDQLFCMGGLFTYEPSLYCLEDGSAPPLKEIFRLRRQFARCEGVRVANEFERIAQLAAQRDNFNNNYVACVGISHGGPLDWGLNESMTRLGQSVESTYGTRPDVDKGQVRLVQFLVRDMRKKWASNTPAVELLNVID
jgi:hypothetical protein